MLTISNAIHVMVGLLEMDAIVIKENGSHILVSTPKPGNMFYSSTQEAEKDIGSQEISVLNFNKNADSVEPAFEILWRYPPSPQRG
ncbi:hypothetical protein [Fibrobacter sp.]